MAGGERLSLGVRSDGIRFLKPFPAGQMAAAHHRPTIHDQCFCQCGTYHGRDIHRNSGEVERHTALYLLPILMFHADIGLVSA